MMSGEVVKLRDMRQNELLAWLDLLQSRNIRCLLAPEHNQIELNTLHRNLLEAQAEIYRRASAPTAIATPAEESKAMAEKCELTDEEVVEWYKERARINCMCTEVFAELSKQHGYTCPCKCHPGVEWLLNRQYMLAVHGRPDANGETRYHIELANSHIQEPYKRDGRNLGAMMQFLADYILSEDKR